MRLPGHLTGATSAGRDGQSGPDVKCATTCCCPLTELTLVLLSRLSGDL